jgi:hypothetical protein
MSYALADPTPMARPPSAAAHFNAYLLHVEFAAAGGEDWSAIGVGDSIPDAIAAARDALPAGMDWKLSRWNHLYGD